MYFIVKWSTINKNQIFFLICNFLLTEIGLFFIKGPPYTKKGQFWVHFPKWIGAVGGGGGGVKAVTKPPILCCFCI